MTKAEIARMRRQRLFIQVLTGFFIFASGWWLRGFVWFHFHTTQMGKIASQLINGVGGLEGTLIFLGAVVTLGLNVRRLFASRKGDKDGK